MVPGRVGTRAPTALTRSLVQLHRTRTRAPTHVSDGLPSTLDRAQCVLGDGWQWVTGGATRWTAGTGYLKRASLTRFLRPTATPSSDDDSLTPSSSLRDEDDPSAARAPTNVCLEACTVSFSICYSPSYAVPVLWFEAHKASGAPLTLSDFSTSTIFHSFPSPSPSSPSSSQGSLPLLSQSDHPVTNRPAWFLHPCETEGIVAELVNAREEEEEEQEEAEEARRWLESWLAVVGSVVDLRG